MYTSHKGGAERRSSLVLTRSSMPARSCLLRNRDAAWTISERHLPSNREFERDTKRFTDGFTLRNSLKFSTSASERPGLGYNDFTQEYHMDIP